MSRRLDELVLVYNADGGLRGELAYAWGHLRHTTSCSLCELTHATVRPRRTWVEWRSAQPFAITAVHRNERTAAVAQVSGARTPCAVARSGNEHSLVLGPDELDACDGDLDVFDTVLRSALGRAGYDIEAPPLG